MKNLHVKNLVFAGLIVIFSGVWSKGFSQNVSGVSLSGSAIKLAYNYPSDKDIKYLNTSKVIQDMDINGQSMLVNVTSYFRCNVRSAGRQGENLNLEIRIDTMAQNIETPEGSAGGTMTEVKGKVFNMIITPEGKVIDLTEAAKIVYIVEGSGESNLEQSFLNHFPVLPAVKVKTGDSWITRDTLNSKTQSMSMWMPVEANYKFEGIEKINDITCARISATLTGSRKMNTQTQGMDINTTGTFTGTTMLLFAVKKGYFIKETVTTRMKGIIEILNQNMSFPVVMDITSINEVMK